MGGTGGLAVPIRKFDNLEALLTGVQHVYPSPDSSAPFPLSPPGRPDPALLSGPMRLLVHHPITPSPLTGFNATNAQGLWVAFEAHDAKFMAAPVVEAYTRLSGLGMEFVMETAKDSIRALSILDPSFGFVALFNLGLCSRQSASVEFTMRLWHYHVWSSQASLCMGGRQSHHHVQCSQACMALTHIVSVSESIRILR